MCLLKDFAIKYTFFFTSFQGSLEICLMKSKYIYICIYCREILNFRKLLGLLVIDKSEYLPKRFRARGRLPSVVLL